MKSISNTESFEHATTNNMKKLNSTIKKNTKNRKAIILLSITIAILILIICLILIYFLLIKKEKSNKEKKIIENFIEASYSTKAGKEMTILNPNEIGLINDDYSIEEIEFLSNEKNNLRFLKELIVNDGKYVPSNSGILSAKIIFKNKLNNLDGLFKDNKELIKVNLTNLDMNEVTSMKSTFSGCSNLKEINLDGINSSKLIKMENTFENCTELQNLNLSPLNTTNLVDMKNIFSGCKNLKTLNLSSFNIINNNIFNGIESKPNIIANEKISNKISEIFYELFSVKINIIIIGYYDSITDCIIGEKEKCKTCSKKIKSNCLECNDGYYLPYHEMDNKICLSCNIIAHCSSCFGEKAYTICSSCLPGYNLIDNKCIEKEIEIPICTIGDKEKCKACKANPKYRNQCETCNEGYYIPEGENKTKCEKCDIEGCLECFSSNNNKSCSNCQIGFSLINNKCIKEACVIGENEKCTSCRNERGKEKVCATCNDGYFIQENSNSFICSKCSINNCKKCQIISNIEICLECKANFTEAKNSDGIIEMCSCPPDHKLNGNLCLEYENWIEMEYNVIDYSVKSQLMNTIYTNINLNEIDLYINNSIVSLTQDSSTWDKPIFYKFNKNGVYKIRMNIKKTLY